MGTWDGWAAAYEHPPPADKHQKLSQPQNQSTYETNAPTWEGDE